MFTNLKLAAAFVLSASLTSPSSLGGRMVEGTIGMVNNEYRECVTELHGFMQKHTPHLTENMLDKAYASFSIRATCLGWE